MHAKQQSQTAAAHPYPRLAQFLEDTSSTSSRARTLSKIHAIHRNDNAQKPLAQTRARNLGTSQRSSNTPVPKRERLAGVNRIGTNGHSGVSGDRATPSVVSYRTKNGVYKVTRSPSMKQFNQDAPLAKGNSYKGASFRELESVADGQRRLRVRGREFLGEVLAGASLSGTTSIGARLGVFPVNPEALGGRLKLYAQQFEENKLLRSWVEYEPVVPATTAGAIAICFRNDVGTQTTQVGRTAIMHAATLASFVQTSVWDPVEMEIKPEDALKKYFDEGDERYRVACQGFVELLSASDLADGTFGNLYLCYEMDFFGEALDFEVTDVDTTLVSITSTAATATGNREPLNSLFGASAGTALGTLFATYTPVEGDILYGPVRKVSSSFGAMSFRVQGQESDFVFSEGMCLWAVVCVVDSGGSDAFYLMYYSSLDAVNENTDRLAVHIPDRETNNGQILWSAGYVATSFPVETAFTFDARIWNVGGE